LADMCCFLCNPGNFLQENSKNNGDWRTFMHSFVLHPTPCYQEGICEVPDDFSIINLRVVITL
jgi:hypothetical protein